MVFLSLHLYFDQDSDFRKEQLTMNVIQDFMAQMMVIMLICNVCFFDMSTFENQGLISPHSQVAIVIRELETPSFFGIIIVHPTVLKSG